MDYRGIAALIIAASLGLSFPLAIVGLIVTGKPLGDIGGEVMSAIGGAMVGALAGYIAGKVS